MHENEKKLHDRYFLGVGPNCKAKSSLGRVPSIIQATFQSSVLLTQVPIIRFMKSKSENKSLFNYCDRIAYKAKSFKSFFSLKGVIFH